MEHVGIVNLVGKGPGALGLSDDSFHGVSISLDDILVKWMNLKIIFCFFSFIQEYIHHKRYRNNKTKQNKTNNNKTNNKN